MWDGIEAHARYQFYARLSAHDGLTIKVVDIDNTSLYKRQMVTGPDGKGRDCKSQVVKANQFDSDSHLQS
jgi:hypothetical protein